MKSRKLKKRGIVRYFRDDMRRLWKYEMARMLVANSEGWNSSNRNLYSTYEYNFREIKKWQAKKLRPELFEEL